MTLYPVKSDIHERIQEAAAFGSLYTTSFIGDLKKQQPCRDGRALYVYIYTTSVANVPVTANSYGMPNIRQFCRFILIRYAKLVIGLRCIGKFILRREI